MLQQPKVSTSGEDDISLESSRLPLVSILMPVRNEEEYIARSLGSVLAQDYPAELIEVIVSDGMSDDQTRAIVRRLQEVHPNVGLVDNPGRIAATALNLAASVAHGEILIRVDGHCEIAPDYVRNCVRHLMQDGVEGVGGSVETVGETETARAIAVAMSSVFGVGGSAFRTVKNRDMLSDTIPFPAYTRELIERIGPYDETMVRDQDDEYNYRIRESGGRLLLAADVQSRYYSRASMSSLWRQYFGYGYWKARVLWKHPRQMRARQFVPSVFVLGLTASALFCPTSHMARRLLLATVSAYLASNGIASVKSALSSELRYLPRLSMAFAAMHLSYGLGFLLGNGCVVAEQTRLCARPRERGSV